MACWALLLQALIPLVPMQSASAATNDVPAWALASICHIAAAPAAAADGNPTDPVKPAPTGRAQLCPVCVGLHLAGTFVPPPPVAVPAPTQTADAGFIAGAYTAPHPSDRASVQARAPPAIG